MGDGPAAFVHVEQILPKIEADPRLEGAEAPIRIYLTCYQVLDEMEDKRAGDMLRQGYHLLQDLLREVTDEVLKRSMEQNIPTHDTLLTAYAQIEEKG